MISINLLPWRQKYKEEIKQQTIIYLILSIFLGVLVVIIINFGKSSGVDYQLNRNKFLQSAVNQLNNKIQDSNKLIEQKQKLFDELTIMHALVINRNNTVDVFNQLIEIIPEDTFFNKVILISQEMTVMGLAKFNNNISELMRNFRDSQLFDEPVLTSVKKTERNGEPWNEFNLKINCNF